MPLMGKSLGNKKSLEVNIKKIHMQGYPCTYFKRNLNIDFPKIIIYVLKLSENELFKIFNPKKREKPNILFSHMFKTF